MITGETRIGVLGAGRGATVTARGQVRPERAGWELDWWIGAEDRWHFAADEVAVRQSRVDDMPVLTTAMRVPAGDAVQRVYAAPVGSGAVVVVDIANESPAPFVVALVVNGARTVDLGGPTVYVDGRAALHTGRAPSRWALTADATTRDVVTRGDATDASFVPRHDRAAAIVAAFLHPLSHRNTLRAVVAVGTAAPDAVDLAALPPADDAARGWRVQLARGMQVDLPDPALQHVVDAARADVVLAGQAWKVDPTVVAVLEDWGFDAEAAEAWSRLTGRERRRLGRRSPAAATWREVRADTVRDPVARLAALRALLVREREGGVDLLAGWPRDWNGQSLDVRAAPTRAGEVSYSLRGHGERVALLWDAPAGLEVRIPGIDPTWSTREPRGEALLEPSAVGEP